MTEKRIKIVLETSGAKKNADDLDKSVKSVGKSANESQLSLNKLAAAIATAITAEKIISFADAFTSLQNQLKRTTNSAAELSAKTSELLKVSNDTRTGIAETVDLYTSLKVSTDGLGYSQGQIVEVTKTINNLFLESGKSAEDASRAIRQLGQALDKGKLNGDEFIAVSENAPGILRAIQKETGLTRDGLAQMAEQGKLTSEIIVKSLQSFSNKAQEAADKTQITLAQSLTVAKNNAIFFIGSLDSATQASSSLAKEIISLSESLASTESIQNFISFIKETSTVFSQSAENLKPFENELKLLSDIASSSLELVGGAFRDLAPNVKSSIEIITVQVASFADKISAFFTRIKESVSSPFDDQANIDAFEKYNQRLDAINSAREESINLILSERNAIIDSAKQQARAATTVSAPVQEKAATISSRPLSKEQLEEQKKLNKDLLDAQIGVIDDINKESARQDAAKREIDGAKTVTQQLQSELESRRKISVMYYDLALNDSLGYYDKERKQLEIAQAEKMASIDQEYAKEADRVLEQRSRALENKDLESSDKILIENEYNAQIEALKQTHEEKKTAIELNGKIARDELAKAEHKQRLDDLGALGNALMTLGHGQSKKIFKVGQTLALAQAAVALPTSVLESFKNGGGYPWGIIPAAAMLATGLKNIQQIKNAGAGLGGGGGGPTPSISLGSGGMGSQIPTSSSSPELLPQQKKIVEFRGNGKMSLFTGEEVAEIIAQSDNAIVIIDSAREDAARRNVIGVTAR